MDRNFLMPRILLEENRLYPTYRIMRLASVAGAVIQAIGRPEFEDGLRTGVLQEDCWCPCGVRTKPMVTAKHPFGVGHDPGEVWMGIYVHSANQTPTAVSRTAKS